MREVVFDEAVLDDLFGTGRKDQTETPSLVPVEEKAHDELEASSPELFSLQEAPLQEQEASTPIEGEGKPATAQPRAGVKSPKPFDFAKELEAYEKRRIKGQCYEQRIIKALEGNDGAQDYVKLYFASVSVMWDVDKFRQRIKEDIAVWTSLREKYGDGKITNYSRSIETGKLILEALKNAK